MATKIVPAGCGFVLTAEGREALCSAPMCSCERRSFTGALLVCPECGTVYGTARQVGTRGVQAEKRIRL